MRALVKGGADPKLTNGDGAHRDDRSPSSTTGSTWPRRCSISAPTPNDGSLYFAVDMHDATTDMRAHDGSRLRADHPNKLTALDLVKLLLDRGADPNKPFVGPAALDDAVLRRRAVNARRSIRAAMASDVEALKLMIAHGAQGRVESRPRSRRRKDGGAAAARGRGNANVGKTPVMVAMNGGRGAAFAAGPGFDRLGAPPFREAVEPRAGRGASRCCSPPAPIRTPRRRTARRCCTRRSTARQVRDHPCAGRRRREARRRQQGQPDAAAAGREAGAAAAAGQQHGSAAPTSRSAIRARRSSRRCAS